MLTDGLRMLEFELRTFKCIYSKKNKSNNTFPPVISQDWYDPGRKGFCHVTNGAKVRAKVRGRGPPRSQLDVTLIKSASVSERPHCGPGVGVQHPEHCVMYTVQCRGSV